MNSKDLNVELTFKSVFLSGLFLILVGCQVKEEEPLLQLLASNKSGITFTNKLQMRDTFNILDYMYFFNGGGVAVGDLNNDGLDDIYFGGNQVSNVLYLNEGGLTFSDITQQAGVRTIGWTSGVAMVDINADGHLDIYVCQTANPKGRKRANLLFINNGDLTFTEQALEFGLADTSYTTHAAFFDYDRDGDLDVYLLNHDHQFRGTNSPTPKRIKGEAPNTDRLYENYGSQHGHPVFRDVSKRAGILNEGFGLGVSISDLNEDHWPDIYVSNDFIGSDILYINQKDGTFINEISSVIAHQSHNGMGNDIADFNNDLRPDIFVADMLPNDYPRRQRMAMNTGEDLFHVSLAMGYDPQYTRNTLQLHNGTQNGHLLPFSEIAQMSGVHASDWSWSAIFGDLDNDGWKDLLVTNGYFRDLTDQDFISYKKRHATFSSQESQDALYLQLLDEVPSVPLSNKMYLSNADLTFQDISRNVGFNNESLSNGAVWCDLDNDGDLEVVTNNIDEKASIYNNLCIESTGLNYVQLKLRGSESNPAGIGAKVTVFTRKGNQLCEQQTSRGFQSGISSKIHFGLGKENLIDSIAILWPDGKKSIMIDPNINAMHTVKYEEDLSHPISSPENASNFMDVTDQLGLKFSHRENDFQEFKSDRSLTYLLSQEGPGADVGDLNGDGLEDFVIGGAAGDAPTLFFQNALQHFDQKTLDSESKYEDVAISIFDADLDGDLDLYFVSGGTEYSLGAGHYQDRLLLNDGKGFFTRDTLSLPSIEMSGSCVVAADFDKDGDLDLFIGARTIPGSYPMPPSSALLENRNGVFRNITDMHAPALRNLGMVTDAIWSDYNQDGWIDLIIVGDWMPIVFLRNDRGKFLRDSCQIQGMKRTEGWWRSIQAADFDGDGDEDYILGNQGLNSDTPVSANHPARLFYGDFDQNGIKESIPSQYYRNNAGTKISYPTISRDEMIELLPTWKKRFGSYAKYAETPMDQLVHDHIQLKLEVHISTSIHIQNMSPGNFSPRSLPIESQVSTINDFLIMDYNGDPYPDLVTIGNSFSSKVSTGRYDASLGSVLLGSLDGPTTVIPTNQSGILANGNTRRICSISMQNSDIIVIIRNNDKITAFSKR